MGRPKGSKKTGGATRGSVHLKTLAAKDDFLTVWEDTNADGQKALRALAKKDPAKFAEYILKLLPSTQEVDHSVSINVDLGAALIDAQARLNAIEHDPLADIGSSISTPISVTPEPVTLTDEALVPPPSRSYQLDDQFDVALDEFGKPISGDV
jgi:hypothetical protein